MLANQMSKHCYMTGKTFYLLFPSMNGIQRKNIHVRHYLLCYFFRNFKFLARLLLYVKFQGEIQKQWLAVKEKVSRKVMGKKWRKQTQPPIR